MVTTGATVSLTAQDEAAIRAIVGQMEAAWNAGDGDAFGAPFTEDADYVIVDGMYIQGRPTIAAGHQQIFSTYYRGSAIRGTVEQIRPLRDDIALAHVRWQLRWQAGPETRDDQSRTTLVLARGAGGWQIAAFQNTPIVRRVIPGQ